MSEYGPPCIDPTQENITPDKAHFMLYRDTYYSGCTNKINDNYTSGLYREVWGFNKVSEFKIFEDNGIL
jgi:hypothetical protein